MKRYPARLVKEKRYFALQFIDFTDAVTQGETMVELIDYAQDALSLAIKHCLDRGKPIPPPSKAEGDDILFVEPYPEITRRMSHKKECRCPVCRHVRGERKKTKKDLFLRLSIDLATLVEEQAEKKKTTQIAVIEEALTAYFAPKH